MVIVGGISDAVAKIILWFLYLPPSLPPPACSFGSCTGDANCAAGQQCGGSGCCILKQGYEDYKCSVDGSYLIKRVLTSNGKFAVDWDRSYQCASPCTKNSCEQKEFTSQCSDSNAPMLYGNDSDSPFFGFSCFPDEEAVKAFYDHYVCSSDGRSVINEETKQPIKGCTDNYTCAQTKAGYVDCTRPDYYIRPKSALIDRVCQGNSIYMFDKEENAYKEKIGDCSDRGCFQGSCVAKEGEACSTTTGAYFVDRNGVPMACNKTGRMETIGGLAPKVRVISDTNVQRDVVLETLGLLPDDFLASDVLITIFPSKLLSPLDTRWQSFLSDPYSDATGRVDPLEYQYHQNITLAEQDPEALRHTVVHELMHAYAGEKLMITPLIPFATFYNTSQVNKYDITPKKYFGLIGCRSDGTFTAKPFTDHGATNCTEEFAEEGEGYVLNACEFKKFDTERYGYFRDEVFGGREYLPAGGCGN